MEEANAIKLALLLAKQKGWSQVQIYGANRILMHKLESQDTNDSLCTSIIENILDLKSLFHLCSFHHVDSKLNVAARKKYLKDVVVWEESFRVDP